MGQSEFVDQRGYLGGQFGRREGEAEPGGEGQGFLDGEERKEGILLRDVAGDSVDVGRVDGAVVEEEGAGVRGGFAGEDLEEGGFSGAAGADNGKDLAGFGLAMDVGKEVAVADGGFCGGEDFEKWRFGVMGLDLVADSYGLDVASFILFLFFFLLLHFNFLIASFFASSCLAFYY